MSKSIISPLTANELLDYYFIKNKSGLAPLYTGSPGANVTRCKAHPPLFSLFKGQYGTMSTPFLYYLKRSDNK